MTGQAVAVTGLGLVTPAGIGVPDSWRGVCSGRSTARRDPNLAGLAVDISCTVPDFDAKALVGRRSMLMHDRFSQLAIVAGREAVAHAGLDPSSWDGARVGVVMGCGLGGVWTWEKQHDIMRDRGPNAVSALLLPMLVPNMVAGHLAMEFQATGPNFVVTAACASGGMAIACALPLLRDDLCDVVLVGGTDAAVSPLIVTAFTQMGALSRRVDEPVAACRPFDKDRDGFVIGEASAVLVLEREASARARGARPLALVAGAGASADAHHMTAPDPDGQGIRRAVQSALSDAAVGPSEVDHVNAHGTSTPLNDTAEARALRGVLGNRPSVTSTKGVLGHSLGATGAVEAALTVLAIDQRTVPPTANLETQDPEVDLDIVATAARAQRVEVALSTSYGFGGQNSALVFTAA